MHAPLTPGYAADEALRDAAEHSAPTPVHLVDEILVSQNLPLASSEILTAVLK